jgi:predicted TIM-barrel fold metal-dependent hydrolase
MVETTRAGFTLRRSGTLPHYPTIQLILPHAGATIPVLADRVATFSMAFAKEGEKPDIPRFYQTLRSFYYDLAGFPLPRQLPSLLEFADPKRILYGSDWPFTPEGLVRHLAKQLDTTPLIEAKLREDVMRNNALALFPTLMRN